MTGRLMPTVDGYVEQGHTVTYALEKDTGTTRDDDNMPGTDTGTTNRADTTGRPTSP